LVVSGAVVVIPCHMTVPHHLLMALAVIHVA
jgi:hypothetical protein